VENTFGRFDVSINNAGTINTRLPPDHSTNSTSRYPSGFLQGSTLNFLHVFSLNFFGTYLPTRNILPLLIKPSGGAKAVKNIVSGGLHMGTSSSVPVAYAVSKSAVARLTEHLDSAHREGDGIVAFALHLEVCGLS
jgi:NAD(P)-dependent dehydrogenase (short-subunit alcohol dehydrogenase family)